LFFNCTVAFGTGVPSGKVTLIFRLTIAGGSGTVMLIVPVSPTMTVIEAACSVAPVASDPAGLAAVGVEPATVVDVVDVVGDWPFVHVGGQVEATDNVNVTGPDVTVERAEPVSSVVRLLLELLLRSPGASGAVQRTATPVKFSPDAVFTEIATDERDLRSPDTIVIGM
jgi:hypothetical protein